MEISGENILLVGSVLLIAGVLVGKSSYRTGLPLLLIFLLVGMAFGVDGLGISFENMHTAQFVGMVALCVILFTGGTSTEIKSIRPVIAPGLLLSTLGVLAERHESARRFACNDDSPRRQIHCTERQTQANARRRFITD